MTFQIDDDGSYRYEYQDERAGNFREESTEFVFVVVKISNPGRHIRVGLAVRVTALSVLLR